VQDRHDDLLHQPWVGVLSNVLGGIGFIAGILGWVPGLIGIIGKIVGVISGALGAFISCSTGSTCVCVLAVIGAAIAGLGLGSGIAVWATRALSPIAKLIADAIDGFIGGLGNPTDLLNLIVGIGCSTRKC